MFILVIFFFTFFAFFLFFFMLMSFYVRHDVAKENLTITLIMLLNCYYNPEGYFMNDFFEITSPFPDCTITPLAHGSPAWLEARRTTVSASDLPILMGIGTITPLQLYMKKQQGLELESTRQMQYGLHLEPLVCDWLCEDIMADKVKLVNWHCLSKENSRFSATIDAIAYMGEERIPCELKTAVFSNKDDWEEETLPSSYMYQVQWQLLVTGCPTAYLACLPGGNASKLMVREIHADMVLQSQMVVKAVEFLKYLDSKTPPPVSDPVDLSCLPNPEEGVEFEPSPEFMATYEKFHELKAQVKKATTGVSDLEAELKVLKATMAQHMGTASKCIFPFGGKTMVVNRKVIEVKEKIVPASSYQRVDVKEAK